MSKIIWWVIALTGLVLIALYSIRSERQFPSAGELRAQILRDVGVAKKYWQRVERWCNRRPSVY